jgi:TatD DNase family protein
MLVLTDTHCHLDFDRFDSDRDQVLKRAKKRGLSRILVPGIDLNSSRAAVALAEKNPNIFAAVGIHPNNGSDWNTETRKFLVELADHPKVVAIGEIGLDFYRDWTPQPLQRMIFQEQLEIAAEVGLPVIIHNREAHYEVIPALIHWQEDLAKSELELANNPGVLHSYSGNIKEAEFVLKAGYYLGITGPVTFKNALEMQEVAQKVPPQQLLIETDAPFLTPHPNRGKRNEPSYVYYVAEKIAELRGISPEDVGRMTSDNAKNLFRW